MATTLVYTVSPYTPFTKILSANANQDKADIKSRINWAGGTSATTGLGDDNIQSITATGGGLTRATKLKVGTAYAVLVNSSTGAMSELVVPANQTVFTNGSGVPVAGVLPLVAGGLGSALTLGNPGDTLVVNSGGTAVAFSVVPSSPPNKVFNFYNFS